MKLLRAGDRIKDNDPRMGGRVLTVRLVLPDCVKATAEYGRRTTVALHRIHVDGKPRRSGFDLVQGQ